MLKNRLESVMSTEDLYVDFLGYSLLKLRHLTSAKQKVLCTCERGYKDSNEKIKNQSSIS